MGDVEVCFGRTVCDDGCSVLVGDDEVRELERTCHDRLGRVQKLSVFVGVLDCLDIDLRVVGLELLEHEVRPHDRAHVASYEVAWVPVCGGCGYKAVDVVVVLLRRVSEADSVLEEHAVVTHSEIAFERMNFPQVEIDEPRVCG